jgi:hypothetical protein
LVIVLAALALAAPAGAAVRRTPTLAPSNTVVDGPSAAIMGLSGLSVARDGTGGLVYLKDVGGVTHVFVSPLLGGRFQPPTQLDPGLAGPSSHPVIAASNGGLLAVAFVNGGELYAMQATSALSGFSPPQPVYPGASNPALSISTFGKAYLAFTAASAGGSDVRVAYYYAGQWALSSTPFDENPADNAGSGTGRPSVVSSGDGTGIVVWGENGHVYLRRVIGTTPSSASYRADPSSFTGLNEVSADQPTVGAGGDSSYASVAFRETLAGGQTRVLFNRMLDDQFTGAKAVDGISSPAGGSADQPATAPTEFGVGFVTAEQTTSHNLFALLLGSDDTPETVQQVNTLPQSSAPDAAPATAGTVSTLIAWQQDQGNGSPAEIRLRYASDGTTLNGDQVVSSSALGATNAGQGLAAGGDLAGDAAVAWVQGSGAQTRIVSAQLYQNPGGFSPTSQFAYSTRAHPVLSWSAASEEWGNPTYAVKFGGALVAQTTATAVRVPGTVAQGRHVWSVTAINQAGGGTVARSATVFVDSLAPVVSVRVTGPRRPKGLLHVYVHAHDTRPGLPSSRVSGVNTVQVRWGDGAKTSTHHSATHAYRRRRTFTLTVVVTDRAGNRTAIHKKIRITGAAAKTKKPTKRKGKGKPKHVVRRGNRG